MVKYLYNDLETYSDTPLKHGTHAYAEKAGVLLWAYALDDGEPQVWDVASGDPMPMELEMALDDPEIVKVWHNGAMFDLVILAHAMPHLRLPIEEVEDTMVLAYMHGLPGSLDALGKLYRAPEDKKKDKDGGRLIKLFCLPPPRNSKKGRPNSETHPEEWEKFKAYAARDIEAMRHVHKHLPRWNCTGEERAIFELDQRINRRGIRVDVALARAAMEAVDTAQANVRDRTSILTDNALGGLTQRDKILQYILSTYGIELPDLKVSTVERQLHDEDIPEVLRELLMLRVQAGSASTRKYKALMDALSSDGRIRGLLQYCGAQRTMRWAGRTFQPQNLPSRGVLDKKEIPAAIDALLSRCADLLYDDLIKVASSVIRSCLVPSKGKRLHVSDLSNIEGRLVAWFAGEEWKLEAFRAFDLGVGHDLYVLAYAKAFNVSPEEVVANTKAGGNWRLIGKTMELALGYGGGVGAFVTFAIAFRIDLDAMAKDAIQNIDKSVWSATSGAWSRAQKDGRTYGLSENAWRVCESFKVLWRRAHPNVERMWYELEDAFKAAMQNRTKTFKVGEHLSVSAKRGWVRIHLPSGTAISYASCKMEKTDDRQGITYYGQNSKNKKWGRVFTYSGKLFENVCQKAARDIMAHNMLRAEAQGYDLLLTVHDELVAEADAKSPPKKELSAILAANPPWCKDLPLAASGHVADRYGK